ncbi:TPA: putative holin-like toxin [Streptococcus suis]
MQIDTKIQRKGEPNLSADELMVIIAFASLLVNILGLIITIIVTMLDKK